MSEAAFRLLLIDDDEDEQLLLSDMLHEGSMEEFELTWVGTYEEGREAILSGGYDVCLLDYRLGGRTGIELLEDLKSKQEHTQVVLLTGLDDRGVDLTATRAGATDYLVKGEFTAAVLERSIRYAVERGRTLKALRKASELASLNRVKSAFLTSMSHETRTPLNLIMGMADMLRDSGLRADQLNYLESLRRASADLLLLINDILDLSTLDSGQLELQQVDFNLEQVVDQAVQVSAAKARSKGLMLMYRIAPDVLHWVAGDPMKLRQVLTNLLGNAVKFTPVGEVVLTVDGEGPQSNGILFTVKDTGPGIPVEKLETIFDDFTQGDGSLTRKHGGVGLGLSISRRLVKAMGGELTVTSSEGKGSMFRFRIKVNKAAEEPAHTESMSEELSGKRILLIDDHKTSREILMETMSAWGVECDALGSEAEGMERLRSIIGTGASEPPYSLIIVSMGPTSHSQASGFASEIQRIAPGIPLVRLTHNSEDRQTQRWSTSALKPLSQSRLHHLLCDVLRRQEQAAAAKGAGINDFSRPAKILVVDDSPDNRDLVQVYLMSAPYQLTFEEDGQAAVNRFAAAEFDLILMDVQMPVMDGLAATREIRLLEQQLGRNPIPIIVVSANASLQDMEASSKAGCDLHLAKPLSKADLINVIEEYERTTQSGLDSFPAAIQPILIQIPAGLEDLAPSYLTRRKKEVSEMRELMARSEFGQLATIAHNLKGSGTGYGFPDLTRIGARLNLSASQGDKDALHNQINELSAYLERVQIAAATN